MNVLYISHNAGYVGGANLSLLYLMEEMKKKGVNVYLLMPYKNSRLTLPFRLRGIRVMACKYDWWMKNTKDISFCTRVSSLFSNYISAYKIARMIKKLNINIIHTNSSVINIGGLISKITGIPHVWHIREFAKEHFELEFLYGQRTSMNFMYKYSDSIIAISKAIFDNYKACFNDKLTIIYNGISKGYINIKQKVKHSDEINLLLVGSIYPAKGQLEAIMAIGLLIKNGYDNLHLFIVGSVVDMEYGKKLKSLVIDNNLNNDIHFLEYQKDLTSLRQTSDIELVCSRSEAFGRVTVEAMLSMNPVVGANSGGTKELIIDGYNGLLYKSGDYIDLAEKIKYLIDNNEKIGIMGKNAYNYALENFTAERNSEEIYKIYCELLGVEND